MKKLLFSALLLVLVAGCATTDYPIITDARGDYVGIIRTGHKAYQIPSGQVATIWTDGSDELFSMIYQNQYGDQMLYTFNNFDPTGLVNFMEQIYCDWRYSGCEAVRAWNPIQNDDVFDYLYFNGANQLPACPGARSLSLLVSYTSRLGECGDALFTANKQNLAGEFANLATTTWRGGTAYVVPMNASNTTFTLTTNGVSSTVPIFGQVNAFVTDKLQLVAPMTPNVRHSLRWLSSYVAENGKLADLSISYGGLSASTKVGLVSDGLSYNQNRF